MSNDDNSPYQGYANYQSTRRSYSANELGYSNRAGSFLRNPVIATIALLLGAAILAGVIITATPDSSDEDLLPVVKADTDNFKQTPETPGGMNIPNSDSTVFDHMEGAAPTITPQPERAATVPAQQRKTNAKVENLLAQNNVVAAPVQPTEKLIPTKTESVQPSHQAASKPVDTPPAAQPEKVAPLSFKKPEQLHPAGSSPETLAFVRSVLNKETANPTPAQPAKTQSKTPTKTVSKTAPAKTVSAAPVASLTHYVQLSSIREQSKAAAQWTKIQGKYAAILSDATYRVQRTDLGAKGIYYRIQAGPFTKENASSRCTKIKAITPSGCYIVAK